jgi:hypothetical protein
MTTVSKPSVSTLINRVSEEIKESDLAILLIGCVIKSSTHLLLAPLAELWKCKLQSPDPTNFQLILHHHHFLHYVGSIFMNISTFLLDSICPGHSIIELLP